MVRISVIGGTVMKAGRTFARLCVAGLVTLCISGLAHAGGGSFDSMDDDADKDAGPSYFGMVKARDGAGIADAKVTVSVKAFNSSLILRADEDGHFKIKGFDKSVDPEQVEFSCSQDGYKFFARSRQQRGTEANSPIEVTCILEKQ